jgi:mannan endo-1,4-beta-mannosidase
MRIGRRSLLLGGAALLAGCAAARRAGSDAAAGDFVLRDGLGFRLAGRPYRFVGTNMWYAPWLGADAPFGNRDRLRRELDALAALGVSNVRINASAELSPLRNSVRPAFRDRGENYDETLLGGLDFALTELGRRRMKAVLYLTNFWEWSGGMMTYLHWVNGGRYIDMNDPAHPWPAFPDMAAGFYASAEAVALYHHYVSAVVSRRNRVTGGLYADDPAIMSWQLANEPRPGGSEAVGRRNLPAYFAWIRETARLIRGLDPNHLVSTGSEGLKGCIESEACVRDAHAPPGIDYVTAHIWPQNWGWVDPRRIEPDFPRAAALTRDYLDRHAALAASLGKPLVIEEFGFPRDGGAFDPAAATSFRDRFYRIVYDAVATSADRGGPIAGSNFWAWNGEGRAAHGDRRFRSGDTVWLGDPPHEPQGWYGVFDGDASTKALVRAHAEALAAVP